MNKVTHETITPLSGKRKQPVLSIYSPTHRHPTPVTIRENQTRLKNLISTAEKEMKKHQLDKNLASSYVSSLMKILDDTALWKEATESIAVFVEPESLHIYKLPVECEERVWVDESFDIVPLLAMAERNVTYYVLALAQHNPKVFKGSAYGLEPLDIHLPSSPEEALNIDEMFATSNTVRSGSGSANTNTHGQGDVREAGNEERLKFFRIIDSTISSSKVFDTAHPVVIAATESDVSEYQGVSKLPYILKNHVDGNHTRTELPKLHELTWPVIEKDIIFDRLTHLLEHYDELIGVNKASSEVTDIAQAAKDGRIDTLIMGVFTKTQDSIVDSTASELSIKKIIFPSKYNESKGHNIACKVIENGGTVVGVNEDRMPDGSMVAAMYRF